MEVRCGCMYKEGGASWTTASPQAQPPEPILLAPQIPPFQHNTSNIPGRPLKALGHHPASQASAVSPHSEEKNGRYMVLLLFQNWPSPSLIIKHEFFFFFFFFFMLMTMCLLSSGTTNSRMNT